VSFQSRPTLQSRQFWPCGWVLSALGLWASMNAPLSVYSIALLCIVISGGIGLALPLLELGRDQ
jgi:hypothetical protein